MEKSIESIWKKGFLKEESLVAPKLNNLYTQKSIHIIDKFNKLFKMNLIMLLVFAVAALLLSFAVAIPVIGLLTFLVFFLLVVVGKKKMKLLNKIDKGGSSYEYLKAFDSWLKDTMEVYAKIYRFVYPAIFVLFVAWAWFADYPPTQDFRSFILNNPNIYQLYGIPVYGAVGVLAIALIISLFSKQLYILDMKSVYGGAMKKMEELIADMEELRKQG